MSNLGANIRKLRDSSGLTQLQFGEKIGLAESTISLYESGKREPDINTLINIASFFNVTLDNLVGFEIINSDNESQGIRTILNNNEVAKLEVVKDMQLNELEKWMKVAREFKENKAEG